MTPPRNTSGLAVIGYRTNPTTPPDPVKNLAAREEAAAPYVKSSRLLGEYHLDTFDFRPLWPAAQLYIIERNTRQLVATANLEFHEAYLAAGGGRPLLSRVFVHPDHRRRHLGRVLVDKAIRVVEHECWPGLWLHTAEGSSAEPMYAALGFQPTDIQTEYSDERVWTLDFIKR